MGSEAKQLGECAMNSPKYFVAVFGDPQPPDRDLIESGHHYHPKCRAAHQATAVGDVLLLYCTGTYPKRQWTVPGIGVVLGIDENSVIYRLLPLKHPIPKARMDAALEQNDAKSFGQIRFDTYWFFEISAKSFAEIVKNQEINWPNI